jgi:hypothetical protein
LHSLAQQIDFLAKAKIKVKHPRLLRYQINDVQITYRALREHRRDEFSAFEGGYSRTVVPAYGS